MALFNRNKNEGDAAATNEKKKAPAKAKKTTPAKKSAPAKKATSSKPKKESLPVELHGVILHPLVTEKAATQTSLSKYIFVVDPSANRVQVRNAIRKMYGVNPISVNIIKMQGKKVQRGRVLGKRKDWKKAIVTLPKGTTIDAYEGV